MPTMWQNSTEFGSPPCSPQMPISSFGLVLRPFSTPIRITSPTPSRSMEMNGSDARIPVSV